MTRLALLAFMLGCSSTSRDETSVPVPQPAFPADAGPVVAAPAPDAGVDQGSAERAAAARTVADPKQVKGGANIPYDQVARMEPSAKGPIKSLTAAAPVKDQVRWRMVVSAGSVDHAYVLELPEQIAMPAAIGDTVQIDAGSYGGGPNVIPTFLMTDERGRLLLAINRLPDGWVAEQGRRLSVDRGDTYDAYDHAVSLRGPAGKPVELISDWRAGTIDGIRFFGHGSAVSRKLKGKRPPPPDYVGGWIDYVLIRVP